MSVRALFTFFLFLSTFSHLLSQINYLNPILDCDVIWEEHNSFGECIGNYNNIIPVDLSNDGSIELIVSALDRFSPTISRRSYWYILKYNLENSGYEIVHRSKLLDSEIINLQIVDHNNNEILLLSTRNSIQGIDLTTLQPIPNLKYESNSDILDIVYEDIDNDGQKEICALNNFTIKSINPTNFEFKSSYFHSSNSLMTIGNINDDPNNEIIFGDGKVFKIDSLNELKEVLSFDTDFDLNPFIIQIELTDINNDGKQEIVMQNGIHRIKIFDAINNSTLYDFEGSESYFKLADLNNDNIEDIVIGGEWDNSRVINLQNGDTLFTFTNHKTFNSGVAIADLDSDGRLEIALGSGCANNEDDYLTIINVEDPRNESWTSYGESSRNSKIKIKDLNGDGNLELISVQTLSKKIESENWQYIRLDIFDLITKEIIHQKIIDSTSLLSTYPIDFEVFDYQDDQDLDILLFSSGFKWIVIDGPTLSIEDLHAYNPSRLNNYHIKSFEITKIQNENKIVCINNDSLMIINPGTFNIEHSIAGSNSFAGNEDLKIGDIDGDNENEIVATTYTLTVFEFENNTIVEKANGEYSSNHKLFDWDGSGDLEIISINSARSQIKVLDENLDEILSIRANFGNISPYTLFTNIEIIDINRDGKYDFLLLDERGYMWVVFQNSTTIRTRYLGGNFFGDNNFIVQDYDNDNLVNIILNSNKNIIEINPSCIDYLKESQSFH